MGAGQGRKIKRPNWGKDYCELDGNRVKYQRYTGGLKFESYEGFGIKDILANDWQVVE